MTPNGESTASFRRGRARATPARRSGRLREDGDTGFAGGRTDRPGRGPALTILVTLNAADARARLITLTEDGRKIANRYVAVIRGWFAEALAGWPARDREDLDRMIDGLGSHLSGLAGS
ncbi:hypothetical protein [Amycolatopsis minnesotensis]|uniref:Uncharacterized protein n=1 Tax=Amycolatopsis minnesotensis TaxID=337894 RepID=A0ABN2RMC7_9PSEU